MGAKLIAQTMPVSSEFGSSMEEFIAYVARVSNPDNQMNHQSAKKLLNYLEKNKHWSPFEMANIVIEVETTRDIARQLLRHRSFQFQEFSQRYAENLGFDNPKEARLQDNKNRQNSLSTNDVSLSLWWRAQQILVLRLAEKVYRGAILRGIAKEVARVVLPEGLTKSRLYVNGTLRSWIHYISVRTDPSTQKEHRELAEEISKVVQEVLNGKMNETSNRTHRTRTGNEDSE